MQSIAEEGGGQGTELEPKTQGWQSPEGNAPLQGCGGERQEQSVPLQVHPEEGRSGERWGSPSAPLVFSMDRWVLPVSCYECGMFIREAGDLDSCWVAGVEQPLHDLCMDNKRMRGAMARFMEGGPGDEDYRLLRQVMKGLEMLTGRLTRRGGADLQAVTIFSGRSTGDWEVIYWGHGDEREADVREVQEVVGMEDYHVEGTHGRAADEE